MSPAGAKPSCVELQLDDLKKLEGLSEEEKRTETKRAYNRKIAARARQRTKDMVDGLGEQVAMHCALNTELQKTKELLITKVLALEDENMLLRKYILEPGSISREHIERLGFSNNNDQVVSILDDEHQLCGTSYSNRDNFPTEKVLYMQMLQSRGPQTRPQTTGILPINQSSNVNSSLSSNCPSAVPETIPVNPFFNKSGTGTPVFYRHGHKPGSSATGN